MSENAYPAFLKDVRINYSPKEKSKYDEDDLLTCFINIDYDVTFEFVVYNGVSYRHFYIMFEKVLTKGNYGLCEFCIDLIDQKYWEPYNDNWEEFCESFELVELFGCFADVFVDNYSIPTITGAEIINNNENYKEVKKKKIFFDRLFKNYDYKCNVKNHDGYEAVNKSIREGLMHYFD